MSEAELTQARECYRRRAWSEAYRLLLLADRKIPLGVEDIERLATSAYLIGRELDFHRFLDRAHHAHVQEGELPIFTNVANWVISPKRTTETRHRLILPTIFAELGGNNYDQESGLELYTRSRRRHGCARQGR